MKRFSDALFYGFLATLIPVVADAAGTYYSGSAYQNSRYGNNNAQGYYSKYGAGRAYPTRTVAQQEARTANIQNNSLNKNAKSAQPAVKQGLVLDAGISHQMSNWSFDMNKAGSKLHYDNVAWNVLDAKGTYYVGGDMPFHVSVGASYGKQYGDTSMIDDDISNGGYIAMIWQDNENNIFGYQTGHALSVGKSSGGTQMGFNVGFGLTDAFSVGRVKITPSVGYRYFKHELSTKKNYGVAIDIFESSTFPNCVEVQPGEIQCNPFIEFLSGTAYNGIASLSQDSEGNFVIEVPGGTTQLDVGGTYYYEQAGTSHKYETTWMGPYVALDMEYAIDNNNVINGGIEFGLPAYDSKGDQPYRFDWAHPTSVEDKGSIGDAYHIGLNSNWMTRVSDNVSFSLGFTYDYYKVSDAKAKTNFNATYYQNILDAYIQAYNDGELDADGIAYMQSLENLKAHGWSQEEKKEINSIFKSMGIRAGINVNF